MPKFSESKWLETLKDLKSHCKSLNIIATSEPTEKKLLAKIDYKCLQCKHKWVSSVLTGVKGKAGCPKCFRLRLAEHHSKLYVGRSPANKLSHEQFRKKLKSVNPKVTLISKYDRNDKKVRVKCKICQYKYEVYPSNVLRYGCIKCSGKFLKTTSEHSKEIKKLNKNIELTSEYQGARVPAQYQCKKCSFVWDYLPTNMLRNCVCPSCDKSSIVTYQVASRNYKLRSKGELYALKYMLEFFKADDIDCDLSHGTPTLDLGDRKHRPDFYIKSRNTLVEIKSLATFGFGRFTYTGESGAAIFNRIKKNYRCAKLSGFNYKLMVYNGYQNIKIPKNWHTLKHKELKQFFIQQNVIR